MAIVRITRPEFLNFAYGDTASFMSSIDRGDAFVVQSFYPRAQIEAYKTFLRGMAAVQPPAWHPCVDGVPDFHRINDEYPGSWVRARMHSFYIHRFNASRAWFEPFKDVLQLKNHLRGVAPDADYDALPSSGVISRVVAHQYPVGGGYLAEHVDPTSTFARIQTIVQASRIGADFHGGGLYYRVNDDPAIFLDAHSDVGDLLVLSPGVPHGVAPIDPDRPLDWGLDGGRWMILPVIIRSDYDMDPATKPRQVAPAGATP
ncbi:MAG: hypothetical protein QOF71_842 [Candidatus Eremiobacteraeota bacterium]|jgi:hypothetical protein|nr:hypothetical protein [Candidatus Eremiobacteraeota bacterium]